MYAPAFVLYTVTAVSYTHLAGVNLISQKFTETLRQKGVTEIDVKGREFDADLCEAVAKFAAGEDMQGKVVDVVQTGYMLGDKVLRFAKVVVGE